MRNCIRIITCTCLIAIALTFGVFTLAGFTRQREAAAVVESAAYVLGEVDGNIAIFSGRDMSKPLSITNIELAKLRQADRELISKGLTAKTDQELQQLLEDLGS